MNRLRVMIGMSVLGLASVGEIRAEALLLGPTPYLSFADSPFAPDSFDQFYLEDFEDHQLNVPGVMSNVNGFLGPGGAADSVDADDGQIDGSGSKGTSFFSGDAAAGIRFTFDPGVLGSLPTHAGIVWTDSGSGGADVTFEAYGKSGELLGSITAKALSDYTVYGPTAEDRFFGVIDSEGISAIRVFSTGGVFIGGYGIEVDHLQYGISSASVPEPSSFVLLGLAGVGLALLRRRSIPA